MASETSAAIESDSPYQSLYRRYRPQRFNEVRGQEHVALALRNAVRDGRVAHAYLFSGPRGTGKTSTARILAKALDCESPKDGEPCGSCASCLSITAGSSFDVHELDAASNNGVDAMRDLVARSTLSTPGRWKVYIVDEVHMLSTAASNALLKTLEEPPEHVVFVLATTDPQKVLPTIRSRTQHFEFHLINESTLDDLLAQVAADAGLELPKGAVAAAVRRARGSARDALSVLDQVVAAGVIEDSSDVVNDVIGAMSEADTTALLIAINSAMDAGHDPQQLGVDIIERLRAGFLAQFNANTAMPLTEPERDQVLSLGIARCVRAMELIGESLVAMRDAPEPRITLEVAMIRCTHPEAETSPEAMLERIERIERRLSGSVAAVEVSVPEVVAVPETPRTPAPATSPAKRERTGDKESVGGEEPEPGERPVQIANVDPIAIDVGTPATQPGDQSGTADRALPAGRRSLGAFRKNERESIGTAPTKEAPSIQTHSVNVPGPELPLTSELAEVASAPNLDALVAAWEGQILPTLRPKARAIYQATRFVGVEDRVVLAGLPNAAHILHAEPLRGDIEAALRAHFATELTLKLVVSGPPSSSGPGGDTPVRSRPVRDDSAERGAKRDSPVENTTVERAPATSSAERSPELRTAGVATHDAASSTVIDQDEDLEDLGRPLAPEEIEATAATNAAWAENRLRAAFPGAEEI